MNTEMRIWKLEPQRMDDPNWQASTHRGEAVVRAPDERTARRLASSTFGIATTRVLGEDVKLPPWTNDALVACAEMPASAEYPAQGEATVLSPAGYE